MAEVKKVLHMTFATSEGGTFKITVDNTRDDVDKAQVIQAMDDILMADVFQTSKGEVMKKTKAYIVTEQVQDLEI